MSTIKRKNNLVNWIISLWLSLISLCWLPLIMTECLYVLQSCVTVTQLTTLNKIDVSLPQWLFKKFMMLKVFLLKIIPVHIYEFYMHVRTNIAIWFSNIYKSHSNIFTTFHLHLEAVELPVFPLSIKTEVWDVHFLDYYLQVH